MFRMVIASETESEPKLLADFLLNDASERRVQRYSLILDSSYLGGTP